MKTRAIPKHVTYMLPQLKHGDEARVNPSRDLRMHHLPERETLAGTQMISPIQNH
jgi:hypothetical protein